MALVYELEKFTQSRSDVVDLDAGHSPQKSSDVDISEPRKEELFELLEARTNVSSVLIAGQQSPSEWYDYLAAGHLADAIMDRVFQRSQSIELKGDSMRVDFIE